MTADPDRSELMMFAATLALIGVIMGVLAIMPSCALFRGACAAALPALTAGSTYLADADLAVDEAAAVAASLPEDKAAALLMAVAKARHALTAASSSIAGMQTACATAPDWQAVFKDFSVAWSSIQPLVRALGGQAASKVHDPMAYSLGGGQ